MDKIILASQSPRRHQLMEQAGYTFQVVVTDVDETPPAGMPGEEVPEFLARKKAEAVDAPDDAIVITADTIVVLDHHILGKPAGLDEARAMLQRLSGRMHQVVSGVSIRKGAQQHSFSEITEVYFRPLTDAQIDYYLAHYQPLDKAGAYAIQEWIGLVGIEKIHGDYYNVMGLPVGSLMQALQRFLESEL
jgi:septum formation protein